MKNHYNRRQFLRLSGAGLSGLALLPGIASGMKSSLPTERVVETAYGKLKGLQSDGLVTFKGVPYAGSVSGAHRFKCPAELKPWAGVREALQLGTPSIQAPNQTYGINEPDPAEDCLFLNIWTPACDSAKRPVMVYNHGGGFVSGSGGSAMQDGANLARLFNVVVVETNHRLGLLGFLYLDELWGDEFAGSGNRGVQDIAIALRWVNENIELFGGDPNNVMVHGESGGGMKTSALYAMPEAAPYFNKASIESGPGLKFKSPELATETTELLLSDLGLTKATAHKLLQMPAAQLLEAQLQLSKHGMRSLVSSFDGIGASGVGGFSPVVDGTVLPVHPFSPAACEISKNKPLLVGWNEDEQIFFSMFGGDLDAFKLTNDGLKSRLEKNFGDEADRIISTYRATRPEASPTDLYIAIYSMLSMGLGSVRIAERKSEQGGAPVYLYNFGYKSELKVPGTDYEFGSMHAMDIAFKFYNVAATKGLDGTDIPGMAGSREERFQASRNMCNYWTSFAASGVPSAEGQPQWKPYDLNTRTTMRIDSKCAVIDDRYASELAMWREILEPKTN